MNLIILLVMLLCSLISEILGIIRLKYGPTRIIFDTIWIIYVILSSLVLCNTLIGYISLMMIFMLFIKGLMKDYNKYIILFYLDHVLCIILLSYQLILLNQIIQS